MNDGMYTNIRNYLEEIASKQGQIIKGQERTNDLLNEIRLGVNRTDGRLKEIATEDAPLAGTLETEPPPDAIGPVTVETVKEDELKTTETIEVKDKAPDAFISAVTQDTVSKPKASAKKGR